IEKTRLFNLQYHFSNLARVGVGGYVPVGTREEITSWVAARVRTLRNLMAEDMFNQANWDNLQRARLENRLRPGSRGLETLQELVHTVCDTLIDTYLRNQVRNILQDRADNGAPSN